MRKHLIILLSILTLILAACSETNDTEENKIDSEENNLSLQGNENNIDNENNAAQEETEGFDEINSEGNNDEPIGEPGMSIVNVEDISDDELKGIIEYTGIGEEDELISASLSDGEIKAVIKISPSDLFPAEIIAATQYSQLSDELLTLEGWEVLTVEYIEVGEVSMNRSEKESNEYGDYFPTVKIDELLGVEY